jgi:L-arabonate dehydrase
MEDFYYAGGLPAVLRELGEHLLHLDALTVNGKTIWENVPTRPAGTAKVIRRSPAVQGRRRASRC